MTKHRAKQLIEIADGISKQVKERLGRTMPVAHAKEISLAREEIFRQVESLRQIAADMLEEQGVDRLQAVREAGIRVQIVSSDDTY